MSTTTDGTESFIVKSGNCWEAFVFHIKRVQTWRLRKANVTEEESKSLLEAKVCNHLLQKYMVWRRSLLIFSLPSVFLSSVFGFFGIVTSWEVFNALGVLAVILPAVSPFIFFVTLCLSMLYWTEYVRSANLCSYGWLFSLLAPIWPALLPIEYLLNQNVIRQTAAEDLLVAKFTLGIGYSLQILPLILTIPSGTLRGSLRIRGLLPESSLAGWFIVLIAPIIPLTIFAAIVLVTQLFGNALLLVGVILLLIAPMLYVFRRRLYTEALTEEQDQSLEWNQRIMTGLSLCGVLVIGIWALSNDIFPKFVDVLRFLCEWVGRALTSTMVFADAVFRMTLHQLKIDRKRRDDGHYAEVDNLLATMPKNLKDEVGDRTNGEPVANTGTDMSELKIQKIEMPDTTESTDLNSSFHVSNHVDGNKDIESNLKPYVQN